MSYFDYEEEDRERIRQHVSKYQNAEVHETQDDFNKFLKSEEKKPKEFDPLSRAQWQLEQIQNTVNERRAQNEELQQRVKEEDINRKLFEMTHDIDKQGFFKQHRHDDKIDV